MSQPKGNRRPQQACPGAGEDPVPQGLGCPNTEPFTWIPTHQESALSYSSPSIHAFWGKGAIHKQRYLVSSTIPLLIINTQPGALGSASDVQVSLLWASRQSPAVSGPPAPDSPAPPPGTRSWGAATTARGTDPGLRTSWSSGCPHGNPPLVLLLKL